MVVSEHDIGMVEHPRDDVPMMRNRTSVEPEPVDQVLARSQAAYTRKLPAVRSELHSGCGPLRDQGIAVKQLARQMPTGSRGPAHP